MITIFPDRENHRFHLEIYKEGSSHAKLETSQRYIGMAKGLERSAANFVNVQLPEASQPEHTSDICPNE